MGGTYDLNGWLCESGLQETTVNYLAIKHIPLIEPESRSASGLCFRIGKTAPGSPNSFVPEPWFPPTASFYNPLSKGGGVRNATSATMHQKAMEFTMFILCLLKPSVSHSKSFKQNSQQWPWSRISREAPTKLANSMVSSKRNYCSSLLKPGSSKIPFSYRSLNHISSVHTASIVFPERAFAPLLPDLKKKIWLAYF